MVDDDGREIRAAAAEYATIADPTSRTSVRARVLQLIEALGLERGVITTRPVSAEILQSDTTLRGSILMHLDLVFRSSVTASEVMFTCARGFVRIAEHESLAGFPVGVLLALPTSHRVANRRELFAEDAPSLSTAPMMMVYALATSPPRLGAGAALLKSASDACSGLSRHPQLVAFSPLTGLRARLIRLVDDEAAWTEAAAATEGIDTDLLRSELLDLLARATMPDFVAEPAKSWLAAEAREFAASEDYLVGNFHRSRGATLTGVADGGDPKDSDAMWARAYFDYGRGSGTASGSWTYLR